MNRTVLAALVSALSTFSPALLSSQGPATTPPKSPAPETPTASPGKLDLGALLRDRTVTLVRATKLFAPGVGGSEATYVDGKGHWLVYKDGVVLGIVNEPSEPVEIPQNELKARLLDYTKDHPGSVATPGFVDADSRWFRNAGDLADRSADATAPAKDGLETWQEGAEELLEKAGITTLFVPANAESQASGSGAVVTLTTRTPTVLADGAGQWRLSSPKTRGTSLTRSDVVKGLQGALEAARKYDEAKEKYTKDVAEFEKKRKEFLDYYKKNPLKKGEKVEGSQPQRAPRSRGGRLPRTKEELEKMLEQVPPAMRDRVRANIEAQMKARDEAEKKEGGEAKEEKKDDNDPKKAPAKPSRPKEPDVDPAKESLLRVLAGKETLRVEVHRAEEIRALIDLLEEEGIDRVTILGGTEAYKVAKKLRTIDALVVLRPEDLPETGFDTMPEHLAASAKALSDEGIAVAFGSAGTTSGRGLPFHAARAVAFGMRERDALQALTRGGIDAAGVGNEPVDTGIVLWSGDPLATTSNPVLLVRGRRVRELGKGGDAASEDK
ncbi:MAG: hypothetical protein H6834_16825 [Planctomycetes bacterium]|nr:hypothetical protein [Planctomycetota bacterium]